MLAAVPSAESMHPRPEPDLAGPERAGIKIHDWCVGGPRDLPHSVNIRAARNMPICFR